MEYGASGWMACGLFIRVCPAESCSGQVNEKDIESQVVKGAAFKNGVRRRRRKVNGSIIPTSTCLGGFKKEGKKPEKFSGEGGH
jgi:hypothetical protein